MNTAIMALFIAATATNHLPKGLLSAECYVESHHNPSAINSDDRGGASRGICQVQERTARFLGFRGPIKALMQPKTNIQYAARYLAYQLKRYRGDTFKAIGAYNSGTYREGRDGLPINKVYILKVLRAWREKR